MNAVPDPFEGVDVTDPDEVAAAIARRNLAEQARGRWAQIAPPRYLDAHLDDVPSPAIAAWVHGPEGRNLLLVGPVGSGKTYAALAAVRPFVEAGEHVEVWSSVELLDQLRPGHESGVLERAQTCALLVLDDLGVERPTEWAAERLFAIVNTRWQYRRPIVVTTNASSSADIAERLGERMASRLVGSGAVVVRLNEADRRRTPTPTPGGT